MLGTRTCPWFSRSNLFAFLFLGTVEAMPSLSEITTACNLTFGSDMIAGPEQFAEAMNATRQWQSQDRIGLHASSANLNITCFCCNSHLYAPALCGTRRSSARNDVVRCHGRRNTALFSTLLGPQAFLKHAPPYDICGEVSLTSDVWSVSCILLTCTSWVLIGKLDHISVACTSRPMRIHNRVVGTCSDPTPPRRP